MKRIFCLSALLFFLLSTSLIAFDELNIDPTDLKKSKNYANQFFSKIGPAQEFMARGDYGMARKRLNFAIRAYNKIIEEYKLNQEVVKYKEIYDDLDFKLSKIEAVEEAEKKIKSFERKLDEAQKYFKWKKEDTGVKFLKKAFKIYLSIPDFFKIREDVIILKRKYDELAQKAGLLAKDINYAKKDSDEIFLKNPNKFDSDFYALKFEKIIKEGKAFYDLENYYTAVKKLSKCKKLYSNIKDVYKTDAEVDKAYKLCVKMCDKAESFIKEDGEKIAVLNKSLNTKRKFAREILYISGVLEKLRLGKNNTADTSVLLMDGFKNGYDLLLHYEKKFNLEYKQIFEANPNRQFGNFKTSEIYDLIKNRDFYRKNLILTTAKKDLDKLISSCEITLTNIKNKRFIKDSDFVFLKSKDYKRNFKVVNKVIELCNWAGIEHPDKEFAVIDSYKDKLNKAIDEVKDNETFNRADYPYFTNAMEKSADVFAKETGLCLLYVGMKENNTWTIKKNDFGIPLWKEAKGRGLYHKNEDNFYRSYEITFIKEFNGNGYEPVSAATVNRAFIIYNSIF